MIGIVDTWDHSGISKLKELVRQGARFSKIVLLGGQEWDYTCTVGGLFQGVYSLIQIAQEQNILLEIVTGLAKESILLI